MGRGRVGCSWVRRAFCSLHGGLARALDVDSRLDEALKQGQQEEVMRMFHVINQQRFIGSEVHQRVVSFVARTRGVKNAVEVFQAAAHPSSSTLVVLLEQIIALNPGNPLLVKRVFDQLAPQRVAPNTASHWMLFRLFCQHDDLESAKEHWTRFPELHSDVRFAIPYARLFLGRGDTNEVAQLVQNIKGEDAFSPMVKNFQLEVFASSGETNKVLIALKEEDVPLVTLNNILKSFSTRSEKDLFQLLDFLVSLRRVPPMAALQSLLGVVLSRKDFSLSDSLLKWMQDCGILPDDRMLRSLSVAYLRAGDLSRFQALSETFPLTKEISCDKEINSILALRSLQSSSNHSPIHE